MNYLEVLPDRIVDKIAFEPNTGCWLWTGATWRSGYEGVIYHGRELKAHRLVWMLTRGEIPGRFCVCHTCDVRTCVNPDHLWLGTRTDNNHDRDAKGRGHPVHGERNGHARLTESQVRIIRGLYAAGGVSQRALGGHYGVSHVVINRIIRRKTWRHVTEEKEG